MHLYDGADPLAHARLPYRQPIDRIDSQYPSKSLPVRYHSHLFAKNHYVQITLLAGVAASALAIPGIETAHWLARAFLMGSMLFAICGVLIMATTDGIFYIFFGEDLENSNGQGLTLGESPEVRSLLHRVDVVIGLPAEVSSYNDLPCGKRNSIILL